MQPYSNPNVNEEIKTNVVADANTIDVLRETNKRLKIKIVELIKAMES